MSDRSGAEVVSKRDSEGEIGRLLSVYTFILAFALAAFALVMTLGGGLLLLRGGSPYYVAGGILIGAASIMLARRRRSGAWLYLLFFGATLVWALWEAGLDPYRLLPRVLVLLVLAVAVSPTLLLPRSSNVPFEQPTARRVFVGTAGMLLTLLGGFVLWMAMGTGGVGQNTPLPLQPVAAGSQPGWPAFGGSVQGTRFSALGDINPANVGKLERAWTFRTGDLRRGREGTAFAFEPTPVVVGDKVYLCTSHSIVIALDADTGKQVWRHDPQLDSRGIDHFVCRGVSYHEDPGGSGRCAKRVIAPVLDARLIALDAETGAPCEDFGKAGAVDLKVGLGQVSPGFYLPTSPPLIIGNIAVVGAYVYDNQSTDVPSGVVRAFDVRSGRLVWAWDLGREGRSGPIDPNEPYTRSTPNAWGVFSADPKLGLIYLPTGNASPDLYGGQRTAAMDKYSSSIVALDVQTGAVRWHFQTVHHDLWDVDVPAQPVVIDAMIDNRLRAALLAPTKRGELFLLDRATGVPIAPVEERRVPTQGAAPGERPAPTQPYSIGMPSFAPGKITGADMWGVSPIDQLWCRVKFQSLDYHGDFTPPSVRGAIAFPNAFPVFTWSSVAYDPIRNLVIGNISNYPPTIAQLIPRAEADRDNILPVDKYPPGQRNPKSWAMHGAGWGTPYANTYRPFVSPLGFPCTAPPWGRLFAIDLNNQRVRWIHTLGTTAELAPLGLALPSGTFNVGGSALTATGLAFVGGTGDRAFRAFDTASGRELWRDRLPVMAAASPAIYRSTRTGRQFVVLAAGGSAGLSKDLGDYVVAYALPASAPTN